MSDLTAQNHLAHTIASYVAKHPESMLSRATPATYAFSLAHADELDELWADELYDLGAALDGDEERWYILKAAMADRGQGIRLFSSREQLEAIVAEFEALDESDDEDEASDVAAASGMMARATGVSLSSLRDFVVQVRCRPRQHAHRSGLHRRPAAGRHGRSRPRTAQIPCPAIRPRRRRAVGLRL